MLTRRSRRLVVLLLSGGLVIGGFTTLLSLGLVTTYSLELAWFVFIISYFNLSTLNPEWQRPVQVLLGVFIIGWAAVVLQALNTPS